MNDMKWINESAIITGYVMSAVISICAVIALGRAYDTLFHYLMILAIVVGTLVGIKRTDCGKFGNALMVSDRGTFGAVLYGMVEGLSGMGIVLIMSLPLIFPVMLVLIFIDYMSIINGLIIIAAGIAVFALVFFAFCLFIRIMAKGALASYVLKEKLDYERNTLRCVCPQCGSIFPRPIHACACGQRYPDGSNPELRPSIRGVKHMNCAGCGALLPVTDEDGERGRLDAFCPDCGGPILTGERHPYVISLAGPEASGKTTLAFSAMKSLEAHAGASRPYGFAYDPKTPDSFSPPYVVSLNAGRKGCYLAVFDISGRYFSGDQKDVGAQPQYGAEDAIIFAIDPTAKDSALISETAANDFWQTHHSVAQTSLSDPIKIPVHVVVTHRDAAGDHPDVRAYLESAGLGHTVSSIESSFRDVRYHMCDARDGREASEIFARIFESLEPGISAAFRRHRPRKTAI